VGDSTVPLLRVVSGAGQNIHFGDTVTCTFTSPYYAPLRVKCIGSIEIEIKDDNDRVVPFMFGKSIVALHFRKRKPAYF